MVVCVCVCVCGYACVCVWGVRVLCVPPALLHCHLPLCPSATGCCHISTATATATLQALPLLLLRHMSHCHTHCYPGLPISVLMGLMGTYAAVPPVFRCQLVSSDEACAYGLAAPNLTSVVSDRLRLPRPETQYVRIVASDTQTGPRVPSEAVITAAATALVAEAN